MPAPDAGVTAASTRTVTFPAVPPAPAQPSREELLRRLHERQKTARGGGKYSGGSGPGNGGGAGNGGEATGAGTRKTVERATENAMNMSPAQMGRMEALLEECGGDIALFCKKSGVDSAFVPSLQKAVASITAGADTKSTISAAAAEVMKLAEGMRKR